MTLMIAAAVSSSFRVLATRPCGAPVRGWCPLSRSPPSMSGMTETPVSKPLSPSASFGNTRTAPAIISDGSPFAASAERQCATSAGCVMISNGAAAQNDEVQRQVRQRRR